MNTTNKFKAETTTAQNAKPPTHTAVVAEPITSVFKPSSDSPLPRPAEAPDQKLMVVAICRGRDGQMLITPIDVTHDADDLTPMTAEQMAARKLADQAFRSAQGDMMKALGALYEIFLNRLYRNQFRTFENFCFALYGTHRINDVLMKKINARAKALKSDVNEGL